MSDGGKGDSRRPGTGFGDGWERLWGKKLPPCNCLPHVCMRGVAFDPATCQQPDIDMENAMESEK